MPTPRWYGSDRDVVRIFAGNISTINAAIGPYTMPTHASSQTTTAIEPATFTFPAVPSKPEVQ